MTHTELLTRLAEIVAEQKSNEEHQAAIREQLELLMTEIMEGEEKTP